MERQLAYALEQLYGCAHSAWLFRDYGETGPLKQPAFAYALRKARETLKEYHSSARPPRPTEAEGADPPAEPAAERKTARPAPREA